MDKEFQTGNICYLKDFEIGEQGAGNSLKSRYLGPYEITQIEPHTNTCTLRNIENNKTRRAHLMHLKKYTGDFTTHPITFKTELEPPEPKTKEQDA